MNAELLTVMDYWEREKGISRDVLMAAVHDSLVSAAKKAVGPARQLRVEIDPKSGDIRAYATLVVSERVLSKHDQLSVFDARRLKPDANIGEEIEVEVTPAGFGRIASQYARQALLQQIRRAEKELIFTEFKDRVGDIVSGTVRRFEKSDVTVDLGRYEALLPNRERVPNEDYQVGERLRCYVKAVEQRAQGPEIILSRADPNFIVRLLQLEVAEINDGTIEIKAVAREPGFRTKIAVWTRDEKVDPVGACVGLRGQRVKNIVRELNNEKVDIIKWDPNIRTLLANALAPIKPKAIEVNEARKYVRVLVPPEFLSLAIGKRGQNARLTQKLTGWTVDIDAEETKREGFEEKVAHAVEEIAGIPGITREIADAMVHAGFHSLGDLLEAEPTDLVEIPGVGENAGVLLEAIRAEVQKRTIKIGDGNG